MLQTPLTVQWDRLHLVGFQLFSGVLYKLSNALCEFEKPQGSVSSHSQTQIATSSLLLLFPLIPMAGHVLGE